MNTRFEIEDDIPIPLIKRGAPFDARLAELDELAARDVIAGTYSSDREAANTYLHRYTDRQFNPEDWQERNEKIKTITRRIKAKREKLTNA